MAVNRGVPQQSTGFFLRCVKVRPICLELFNELGGVGLVVRATEKMQERHGKALSNELRLILALRR
jgi:hypothetical protein